ncbi:MAG: prenyltransferase/squalene oxidase repeat-containing protein [Luteolibacter sp.]|jgi:hypothetical protein|nr:prenyltransferase/squalene oxidase repeat-containing protein [Luteolibacter sp.]
MSLHAELSSEALERLHAQRRNSTISSIVIALLTMVLVALILGIFLLPSLVQETPTIVTYEANLNEEADLEQKKVQTNVTRKPSSPTESLAKVIVANTSAPTAVQSPDVDVSTPLMDFGEVEIDSNWGTPETSAFGNVPATMKKRCSLEDRLARLQETGGTKECEDAVVRSLNWFKSTQSADGSWGSPKPAMTGLALLAFLGHCETPLSKDYGDTVLRAITYLVDLGMKTNGKLASNLTSNSWPYEHAIATYALAEASTFCKQGKINVPNLFEVTQKAGQFIIDNQHNDGGWAYLYSTAKTGGERGAHVDSSVTAWQVQALKACHHTGLEFKALNRASNKAMSYIESLQSKDGGFGYTNANEKPHADGYHTMTGGCVLSLQMFEKGSSSAARKGAKYIEENTKFDFNSKFSDLYGHYYEAQVMMNRGGEQWKKYNSIFRDQVLNNQNPDGSWKKPNKGTATGIRAVAAAYVENEVYRTALCTLMLEVYYRFLPGTGVGTR